MKYMNPPYIEYDKTALPFVLLGFWICIRFALFNKIKNLFVSRPPGQEHREPARRAWSCCMLSRRHDHFSGLAHTILPAVRAAVCTITAATSGAHLHSGFSWQWPWFRRATLQDNHQFAVSGVGEEVQAVGLDWGEGCPRK